MAEKLYPDFYSFVCKYNGGMYEEDDATWERFETWLVEPAMRKIRDHRSDPDLVLAYLNLQHLTREHVERMEYESFEKHYGRLAAVLADDSFHAYAMVIQCWKVVQFRLLHKEEVTDEFVHQWLRNYIENSAQKCVLVAVGGDIS